MQKPSIKLWKHQKLAVSKASSRNEFALFFEMGTGKTATTIHILREKYRQQNRLLRTLILCPPIVIENWRREFSAHSLIKPQEIVCLIGSGRQRAKLLKENSDQKNPKILITNYETLLMEDIYQGLMKWWPDILVCDESHKLKDPKTKRSVRTRAISDLTTYRYILTGTPVLNSPMDLFSQYRILDGGKCFGKNFYAFRGIYFYDKNAGMPPHRHFPNWQIKPNAYDEIMHKIESTGMSVKKSECMDLPPMVRKTIHVDLSVEQKSAYEQMKKDFIAYVNDQACVATLAITKALRLQQILSGYIPVGEMEDEKKIIHFKKNPRAEAAREIISDVTAHSKILVWAVFQEDFKTLAKMMRELKIEFVEVHGAVSAKQKQESVDAFNQDERIRVFIGHPGSGGIGINLTRASYSLFYSRNFSLEFDLQADARNHRGGSEVHEKITRIDLVAKDTIDELILERLKNKQTMGDALVREMARELANGK